jgi:hypothetical protein
MFKELVSQEPKGMGNFSAGNSRQGTPRQATTPGRQGTPRQATTPGRQGTPRQATTPGRQGTPRQATTPRKDIHEIYGIPGSHGIQIRPEEVIVGTRIITESCEFENIEIKALANDKSDGCNEGGG